MLIEFSVGNYRSFKDVVTFSMVAADLTADNNTIHNDNLFAVDDDLKLLKSAAIYGANASGKSNLIKALAFMKWFMINSSRQTQSTDDIDIEPFRLSLETENNPSFFEIVFYWMGLNIVTGLKQLQKKLSQNGYITFPMLGKASFLREKKVK
ncbi:hypothetical protein CWATWH0402_3476 [Crocosphaera watsonii WH 0402]|uniref:ATPase AAA-type core domain-containing protein n=1 Tax=Crocosphaera watsonii WH 0402 TaxID=1284629 RepID=T2JN06_CROWT|nr:AAA family ATPase [Crocosphaera watsonii]CCQ66426.1 hypothetical protein CWATWH0402_3476 [Crocosphaera watsonii WH 0402]